jgi:GNAT superfamily N-acetyltransferase
MHRVRLSVRENVLTSQVSGDDYVPAIEETGRGWVVDTEEGIAGFSVGNAKTGNIWALFVDPVQERKGYGRRLHDVMVEWLFAQGLTRLWLGTQPGTRAERFYLAAGWRPTGDVDGGEVELELCRR